jgi:hypothetical protein
MSDCRLFVGIEEQYLIGTWAGFLWKNLTQMRPGESPWEICVIYEQRLLWDVDHSGVVVDDRRNPKEEQALLDYSHRLFEKADRRAQQEIDRAADEQDQ